jgi:hypothetical protein
MRRSAIKPGARSIERGSTFAPKTGSGKRSFTTKKRSGFTPASPSQRAKVRDRGSIVSGEGPCDPCHLTSRQWGGCDHEDCVIPLTREEHRAFDGRRLDVLPYLIAHGLWVELAHAVLVHHYDPVSLAERCTG